MQPIYKLVTVYGLTNAIEIDTQHKCPLYNDTILMPYIDKTDKQRLTPKQIETIKLYYTSNDFRKLNKDVINSVKQIQFICGLMLLMLIIDIKIYGMPKAFKDTIDYLKERFNK